MDFTLLDKIATLGIGAVLAFIVLWWKRQDDTAYQSTIKSYKEESTRREENMLEIIKVQIETLNALRTTIQNLDIYTRVSSRLQHQSGDR